MGVRYNLGFSVSLRIFGISFEILLMFFLRLDLVMVYGLGGGDIGIFVMILRKR